MVEDKCNVYQRSSKESEISDLEERTLSVFSAQYSMQHEVARQRSVHKDGLLEDQEIDFDKGG